MEKLGLTDRTQLRRENLAENGGSYLLARYGGSLDRVLQSLDMEDDRGLQGQHNRSGSTATLMNFWVLPSSP